jgi:hypothetical protein
VHHDHLMKLTEMKALKSTNFHVWQRGKAWWIYPFGLCMAEDHRILMISWMAEGKKREESIGCHGANYEPWLRDDGARCNHWGFKL